MKKRKLFLTTFLMLFILSFAGCGGSESSKDENTKDSVLEEDDADTVDPKEIEAAFEEELMPLEGEELAMMEDSDGIGASDEDDLKPLSDDDMRQAEEEEIEDEEIVDDEIAADEEAGDDRDDTLPDDGADNIGGEENDSASGKIVVKEDGTYISKEEVAVYIHTYGHLPSNYITTEEAEELGWVSSKGNLDETAPGKSIGGDIYSNDDKMLPVEEGRTYQECDIDFNGRFRNAKRIIYSNDGLIFYTEDNYETFEQLY